MRADKRQPDQMREVRVTPGFIRPADGSVLIEIGGTRVICTASIESGVPNWMRGSGKGWVTAEYAMLPRSTNTRTPRESARGRISGRTHEIQRLIGRALRAVTDVRAIPDRTVIVDCDVIQADGGTRTASITGAFLAMSLAFNALLDRGDIKRSPLTDYLAAVSVGIVDNEARLDLNYEEDARAQVDMNIVMTGNGRFVEVQSTAEQQPFTEADLQRMLELGRAGITTLVELQKQTAPLRQL